jgi:hypothetical protein
MGAWADNIITISSAEGAPDDEVTVNVSMTNKDAIASLQVSIPLDENLTLVEGAGELGSRCGSHSLTVGVKDGVLNIFVYSMSMAAISGTSGEVASFKLKLGNQPSTISLNPTKIVLTNTGGATVSSSAQAGTVTTRCAKAQYSPMEVNFGALPIRGTYQHMLTVTNVGNDVLTITNLNFSDVNIFSSTTALPMNVAAGSSKELNITYAPIERGNINCTLKVECNSISKLNTIKLKAQPFPVNELRVQNASGISDEEVTISMKMNNMDAISGFQIEFTLPEQLEYVANSFALSSRKQDHQAIASLSGNKLTIISYSNSDKAFTGNEGEIGSFKVKLVGRNSVILTPSKTVLSATINHKVENVVSAVYSGLVTIKSPRISASSTLDFGAVSVTEAANKMFTIHNYGNAPLTVNRIVFDNENLSIKETLPIVVQEGNSTEVTVVYSSVEQISFNSTMQIYSNDPDQRLWNVTVTGSRFAPNYFSIMTPDVYVDDNLSIDVSVNIYDDITGLQFDLVYPNDLYEPFENNYVLEARAEGMTVTSRQIDENTLRYFCYFLSGNGIAAGDGKVMSIMMKPINGEVPEGTYSVNIKNIKLGTGGMTDKYAGTDTNCSFTVKKRGMVGDANMDEKVNIQDVVAVINIMAGKTGNYDLNAADANGDGKINIVDVTAIINIMAGKH